MSLTRNFVTLLCRFIPVDVARDIRLRLQRLARLWRVRYGQHFTHFSFAMIYISVTDEISWLLKIYHDNVQKQMLATEEFGQSLCVEAKACPKIEDKKPEAVEVEAPFW